MDIDIRKHGFYLILLGVALLYVVLYILLVPDSKQMKKQTSTLQTRQEGITKYLSDKSKIPNPDIIEYHKQQSEKLEGILRSVRDDFIKKDNELEQWFEDIARDLQKQGKKYPVYDHFQAVYSREKNKMLEWYANKSDGMKIMRPTREMPFGTLEDTIDPKAKMREIEQILPLTPQQEIKNIVTDLLMKKAQKQFWLIQKMVKVLEDGKLKKLYRYRWLNQQWVDNTEEMFVRRGIEIAGQIDYGDLSFLMEEMLNNPYFLLEITKVSIRRDTTYRPETLSIDLKWKQTQEEGLEEYFRRNPSKSRMPPLDIVIQFNILDYQSKL